MQVPPRCISLPDINKHKYNEASNSNNNSRWQTIYCAMGISLFSPKDCLNCRSSFNSVERLNDKRDGQERRHILSTTRKVILTCNKCLMHLTRTPELWKLFGNDIIKVPK